MLRPKLEKKPSPRPELKKVGTTEEPKARRRRRSEPEMQAARELFIVMGRSDIGRIRRVYPTRIEAEKDAAQCRKRKCKDVEVRSTKEKR